MIKEYRKKTTIKAEQFDGSKEMVKQYRLHPALMKNGVPTVYFFGNSYIAKGDIMIFAKSEDDEWYPLKSMNKDEFHQTYEEVNDDQAD